MPKGVWVPALHVSQGLWRWNRRLRRWNVKGVRFQRCTFHKDWSAGTVDCGAGTPKVGGSSGARFTKTGALEPPTGFMTGVVFS